MTTLKTRETKIPLSVGSGVRPRPSTIRNVASATTYTGAKAVPSAILLLKTSPKQYDKQKHGRRRKQAHKQVGDGGGDTTGDMPMTKRRRSEAGGRRL